MKRRIMTVISAVLFMLAMFAGPAMADPDFGPGNSSKGPNDGGAKCHTAEHGEAPSPNQEDVPGCKGN